MSDRDYSEKSAVLSADILTMLDNHPESFDCFFFKADLTTAEVVAPGLVEDVVGSIEGSERKISYADPVASRAMIMPDGMETLAFESGEGEDIRSGKEPIVIILKETIVPKQSVITWTEKTSTGEKKVSFYVLESKPFGRAPVAGMKHYCIPLLSEGIQDA